MRVGRAISARGGSGCARGRTLARIWVAPAVFACAPAQCSAVRCRAGGCRAGAAVAAAMSGTLAKIAEIEAEVAPSPGVGSGAGRGPGPGLTRRVPADGPHAEEQGHGASPGAAEGAARQAAPGAHHPQGRRRRRPRRRWVARPRRLRGGCLRRAEVSLASRTRAAAGAAQLCPAPSWRRPGRCPGPAQPPPPVSL